MKRDPSIFIHSTALCESEAIGLRTRVWAFTHIMPGACIGADCNICDHVFVETGARIGDRVTVKNNALVWEKVTIEDDVFIGPNAVFTNDRVPRPLYKHTSPQFLPTRVQRGVTIGASATIVCGVTIHEHAFIGAGTVVIRDVPAHAVVVGNPARQIGWMCLCGEKLSDALVCVCQRRYRLVDQDQGLSLL